MRDESVAAVPCNLCGGVHVSVLSHSSRSGAPLRTVVCRECGLGWSDPPPHATRKFYEQDYRLAYKRTYEPRAKHVLRAGKVALSRLDRVLPAGAWSERQALALYLVMQSAMVAGVVWFTHMPRTLAQAAKLTAWAGPMFVLPAFC